MDKLTRNTLKGIYGALSIPWTTDGRVDEQAMRHNVRYLAQSGVHGLYIGGTTGEFFSFEFDDFRRLVDIFLEESSGGVARRQVGCPWMSGKGVLARVEYAARQGADAIQFTYPGWESMRLADCQTMLADICAAAGETPLVHYNSARGGRQHDGAEYARLAADFPSLIGSKLVVEDAVSLATILHEAPALAHFVGEYSFVTSMAMGAQGMYSSFFALNPGLMVRWYEACIAGDWSEAIAIHQAVMRYKCGFMIRYNREGWFSAARDKMLFLLNPNLRGAYSGGYPYSCPPASVLDDARVFIKRECPKLLEGMD